MCLDDTNPGLWDDLERRGIAVQEPIWVGRSGGTLIADENYHCKHPNEYSPLAP